MQKTVYTTGEAAKICKVSQQTIIRCFDSGQLKGFRVPGSRFRRIPRDQLFLFMRDNGIPTDALESGRRKILVVDDDQDLVELITDVLERDGRFETRSVNNGFDAGMMVKDYRPDLIVLDVMLPDINGKEVELTELKGKVIYLDFWATWCSPCLMQMKNSKSWKAKFKNKDVVFLYLSLDKNKWMEK